MRGRLNLDWVIRSPIRMLVLIAVLVGLPTMVLAQVLVDGAQRASREAELDRVSEGAAAGSEVIAERFATLLEETRTIAMADELGAFIGRGDETALERHLADLLPLYVRDARRLFVLGATGRFVASAPAQRSLRGMDFGRTITSWELPIRGARSYRRSTGLSPTINHQR